MLSTSGPEMQVQNEVLIHDRPAQQASLAMLRPFGCGALLRTQINRIFFFIATTIPAHVYEIRPHKDKRGVNLISDALPFGRLWFPDNCTHNPEPHHGPIPRCGSLVVRYRTPRRARSSLCLSLSLILRSCRLPPAVTSFNGLQVPNFDA
jgi:hypothetical protein